MYTGMVRKEMPTRIKRGKRLSQSTCNIFYHSCPFLLLRSPGCTSTRQSIDCPRAWHHKAFLSPTTRKLISESASLLIKANSGWYRINGVVLVPCKKTTTTRCCHISVFLDSMSYRKPSALRWPITDNQPITNLASLEDRKTTSATTTC